jgi:putative FmdB family regulatory protein
MPVYDFVCNSCGQRAALFYKTIAAYDRAQSEDAILCPHCGSHALVRLIDRVSIQKPGRNYASMSSGEMLSVLESGDSRAVGEMIRQVGQDDALRDPVTRDATDRLVKGEKPGSIAHDHTP